MSLDEQLTNEDEHTCAGTIITMWPDKEYTRIPYSPKAEEWNIGDRLVIESQAYVMIGFGHKNETEQDGNKRCYNTIHLNTLESWEKLQESNAKSRVWRNLSTMIHNLIEEQPLTTGIKQPKHLFSVYQLEDLY